MLQLKNKLLEINLVSDGEYLDSYIKLIFENQQRKKETYKTQKHHIIPRSYFKRNGLQIDNSNENLINLLHKDHLLAHYYLYKCANEIWFREANLYAIRRFIGINFSESDLFAFLPSYQQIKEETAAAIGMLHKGRKVSEATRELMRIQRKGRTPWNKGIYGRKRDSQETIARKSAAQKRVWEENKDREIFRTKGKKLALSPDGIKAKHEAILGKKIYHKGDDERYFYEYEEIPSGWTKGRCQKHVAINQAAQRGKIMSAESSDKKAKAMIGRKVYNNGIINKKFFPDCVPEGFVLGYIKNKEKN